ncbi:MAG: hypothetical protein V2A61_02465 [Calditrichota bacterium]
MAAKTGARSPGSLILQILVLFLIAALILAIYTPKRQWDEQAEKQTLCQRRMENLDYASRFYYKTSGRYSSDLHELINYAERESMTALPAGFKLDRLTREESGIDSFLVSYFDPYQLFSHFYDTLAFSYPAGPDSVVLIIKAKPLYAGIIPETRYSLAADCPITVQIDNRGEQGTFMLVGAPGRLRGEQILPEPVQVRAADYIYNLKDSQLPNCPSTETNYQTWLNVKLSLQADMTGIYQKTPPENSLAESQRLSSLVVFRMLKEADAFAKRDLTRDKVLEAIEDSLLRCENAKFLDNYAAKLRAEGLPNLATAIYDSLLEPGRLPDKTLNQRWEAIRDSSYEHINQLKNSPDFIKQVENLVNDRKNILAEAYFQQKITQMKTESKLELMETGVVNTTIDSVDYYSNPDYIQNKLFPTRSDSITRKYLSSPEIQELLSSFSFSDVYRLARLDTVGIGLACPIEGLFVKKDKNLLEKIFTVKGEKNHGRVVNGDLSWSERR